MRITFISNYFNHHQKPFCDEMYKMLGNNFCFISTSEISNWRKEFGYKEMTAKYAFHYSKSLDRLIGDSDVVITGSAPYELVKPRLNAGRITFFYFERLYKNGIPWIKIPKHAISFYRYYGKYRNAFLLCASAYTSYDFSLSHCFLNRAFKWGYFPFTIEYENIEDIIKLKMNSNQSMNVDVSILWVGRLIEWKHPESMIYLANRLISCKVNFHINIIGTGNMYEILQHQIGIHGLKKHISLLGAMPPEKVRIYMERSDIFAFTSDQNEGWGAVLNESMNSACALIASHAIGSVPFLIKNDHNGIIFHSSNWEDMFIKIKKLIDFPQRRQQIGKHAYQTIRTVWNAQTATKNLLSLIHALQNNRPTPISDGPCSIAHIIKDK